MQSLALQTLALEVSDDHLRLTISPADGRIGRRERAVLFNCASALKYPMPPAGRALDVTKPIDFAAL